MSFAHLGSCGTSFGKEMHGQPFEADQLSKLALIEIVTQPSTRPLRISRIECIRSSQSRSAEVPGMIPFVQEARPTSINFLESIPFAKLKETPAPGRFSCSYAIAHLIAPVSRSLGVLSSLIFRHPALLDRHGVLLLQTQYHSCLMGANQHQLTLRWRFFLAGSAIC